MTAAGRIAETIMAGFGDQAEAEFYAAGVIAAAKEQGAREAIERARTALSAAIDANMLHWLAWDDVAAILDRAVEPAPSSMTGRVQSEEGRQR